MRNNRWSLIGIGTALLSSSIMAATETSSSVDLVEVAADGAPAGAAGDHFDPEGTAVHAGPYGAGHQHGKGGARMYCGDIR